MKIQLIKDVPMIGYEKGRTFYVIDTSPSGALVTSDKGYHVIILHDEYEVIDEGPAT